ncbi:MAG: VOC family protein [Planctomycetota bacterium]|nr:VOC family protein [Planctomycetota bacterium]
MEPQFTRTGFILYVPQYEACVNFYSRVLKLPTLFTTGDLTCFELGDSYLMVEPGGPERRDAEHPTCLRLNVPDVKGQADRLQAQGVPVDYQEHDWGTVAKFEDPAGNLIAFKDDLRFERQVSGAKQQKS